MTIKADTLIDIAKKMDYPKLYIVQGVIATSANEKFKGTGIANIIVNASGLATISFQYKTTDAYTDENYFQWGLDATQMKLLNNNIPELTPIYGGSGAFYNSSGYINNQYQGYSGLFEVHTDSDNHIRWTLSRIYDINGRAGQWPISRSNDVSRCIGTAYATVKI